MPDEACAAPANFTTCTLAIRVSGEEFANFELRDGRNTPEDGMGESEVQNVLFQEIRRTPPLLRNVFLLRDVQQLPMPKVAEVLGISVAAAKSRLLRARSELRSRMSRHCNRSGSAALMTLVGTGTSQKKRDARKGVPF